MVFHGKFVLIALALFLSACGQVQTQVDAYSSIPSDLEPKTVYIAPYKGTSGNDLEWQANAQVFAQVITQKGFTVVSRQRDARLTAYFGFGVDEGETVRTPYSIPQWGVTGYSGASTQAMFLGNSYSSRTTLTPSYGVTGYTTGVATSIVYTRSVSIDMIDNSNRKKVFQSKAVSRGSCNSFRPVASAIISAVLSNFPDGKTGLVSLPMENEC